jgi:hypothetical protein
MSQSATLYRITQNNFERVVEANGKKINPVEISEDYSTYGGTFMALPFVLSKNQNADRSNLINEIFDPKQDIGAADASQFKFEEMEEDEIWDLLDCVSYIPSDRVKENNEILKDFSEVDIHNNYDPAELNNNGIYPQVWHNDDSSGYAFDKRHLIQDLNELKRFFQVASTHNNIVLVYVG